MIQADESGQFNLTIASSKTAKAAMDPEATKADASVSEDVCTLIPTAPAVTAPIMNPFIVTVNADAPIVAPDVVITTDVAVVGLHVTVSPATLLAPDATLGVIDEAKKPEG